MDTHRADIAIIGAGIVGLAHALEVARQGYSTVLFEQHSRPIGASIRNFGMILPLGMAPGTLHERALRSQHIWKELADEAGFWIEQVGTLLPAYYQDEEAVLQEFIERAPKLGYDCAWLHSDEVLRKSPGIREQGLLGALWSPVEMLVDPREVMQKFPRYLQHTYNVTLQFNTQVTHIDLPFLEAGGRTWRVNKAIVCTGAAFETLYPEIFAEQGFQRCKLQMMRTAAQPNAWKLGPIIASGLSLRHYPSFAWCPSIHDLQQRIVSQFPRLEKYGIHVLAGQNATGQLTIGDSHEYGWTPNPFDRPEIDTLILDYLTRFLNPPSLNIEERWHGYYAVHPTEPVYVADPENGVRIVNGLGGTGMTTSFGLAQDVLMEWL